MKRLRVKQNFEGRKGKIQWKKQEPIPKEEHPNTRLTGDRYLEIGTQVIPERADCKSKCGICKVIVDLKVKHLEGKDQKIRLDEKHNWQLLQDNEKEGQVALREIIPVAVG